MKGCLPGKKLVLKSYNIHILGSIKINHCLNANGPQILKYFINLTGFVGQAAINFLSATSSLG